MNPETRNPRIKVLIVEDNSAERRIMLDFLGKDPEIEICTFLSSGFDMVAGIKFHSPDVIITDFKVKDADGTPILEKIRSCFEKGRPRIIVTSSLDDASVMKEAYGKDIDYYVRKPIILSLLKDAIVLVTRPKPLGIDESAQVVKVKTLVRSVGIPLNVLGYVYIVEALIYMISSEKTVFLSEVYRNISKEHDTSTECVEVSIRNAIKKASEMQTDTFKEIFNFYTNRPSNSIFLAGLRETFFINNG